VEGEIDCLTMVQAGFRNTVSVPNGATKGNNNLDYLDNCYKYFESIEKVYLLTDHDEPGENLANELARRIGIEKCYRVHINGFKDVNDQLCQTARVDVSDAKPYPITGIFGVNDHWDSMLQILQNGFPKGWQPRGDLRNMISFHPGYLTIITGIPGHGKSEILDQILMEISVDYDLKGGFFTPENWPSELHLIKLVEKIGGRNIFKLDKTSLEAIREYLTDRVYWIYPEEDFKLESLLLKVRQAVLKYGIRWYVFDPWNKIEHLDDSTNYVSRALDQISNFNKKNGLHCFLVAHPTKMQKDANDRYKVPTLYDISGSANFYNKADIGLCMYKEATGQNTLSVQKVKFKWWGRPDVVQYTWNPENGRYSDRGDDLTNWLLKKENKPTPINFYEREDSDIPF
jgi:twinkle protein